MVVLYFFYFAKTKLNYSLVNSKESLEELRSFIETVENVYNSRSIIVDSIDLSKKIDRIVINSSNLPDGCVSFFNYELMKS